MSTIKEAYQGIADVNLWFKLRSGDELKLSDVPTIIPLRWGYFRNNWEFIKPTLVAEMASYSNPDYLNTQIQDFSKFIEAQRVSAKNINPFSDTLTFNKFYAIFDVMNISDIQLTNEEQRLVEERTNKVRAYTKNDFLAIKTAITGYRDRVADTVGLNDDTFNAVYSRGSIPAQQNATITDANVILGLQQSIKTVDFILANLFAVDAVLDRFALARANANNPNIDIGQYASGRLVRINYGEDLQTLAARYLGDSNKWIDIAIANGLKPPYIDEVGLKIPLISNGSGNQVNISQSDNLGNLNIDKLFINQIVLLQSADNPFPDQRTIVNISQIPVSGEIVIELDGDSDLEKYTISENAHIRVFKPGTVNSGFYVLIPSQNPMPDSRRDETPWFLEKAAEDEKRAKVDIRVGDDGDISFDSGGDISLSYGIDNAIQAVKLKILTEEGSLRYHPSFGLVSVMGINNSDIEAVKTILVDSITKQIAADPRMDRVENLSVEYTNTGMEGPSKVNISMSVRLAGGSKVIPISFSVNV